MSRKIFVNLPVGDLNKSMDFFRSLGFTFNAQFTDETAACMVISNDIYAMLLTHDKFKQFTSKPICDATRSTEVLVCLSCEDREEVDRLTELALAAGATADCQAIDHGFMYSRSIHDLDGHIWELVWMDPSVMREAQEPASLSESPTP